ncbi:MAG: DHH family phosphoesterase [Clostridia bacterium]|nr:DHH family phosphoesterase [Clostridia bacterium]
MKIDSDRVAELLQEKDNILILTHKNPDGDTLGCGVALCRVLQGLGKNARVENSDIIPKRYSYLFEDLKVMDFEPEFIVAVDVADTKLLGERLEGLYSDRVDLCIDHHGSNREFAKELYLRSEDGAASLSLYRIIKKMGVPVTPQIATALYTGLSTDTGCFRYSNASSECYRVAAELIDSGADSARINVLMFETKPLSYFRLLTEVLAGMRTFCDGRVIVLKVTRDMFDRTGATPDQCDAIVAMSRQVEGALCGITMKEKQGGGYKLSLRTHEPLDAAQLCGLLGGGGHARAAGCDSGEDEEESLRILIEAITKALK